MWETTYEGGAPRSNSGGQTTAQCASWNPTPNTFDAACTVKESAEPEGIFSAAEAVEPVGSLADHVRRERGYIA